MNNPVFSSDPTGYIAEIDDAIIGGVLLTIYLIRVVGYYISTPQFRSSWKEFCNTIGDFFAQMWGFVTSIFMSESQKITKAVIKSMLKAAGNKRESIKEKRMEI